MQERDFDVVVYGATGFAGTLTAEYLQETYGGDVRWAVAGRSEGRLKKLVADLATQRPDAPEVAYIVADSTDRTALDAMMARTVAICTTVGPYAKYGSSVVASAVANGTHYCDLTGEPQFVRRMIDAHDDEAKAKGVRVVHCAGFDSIPSDLGVFAVQQAALEKTGKPCESVEYVLAGASGGFSGGTAASLIHILDEAGDPTVRRVLGNPYGLCSEKGPDSREQTGLRYSKAARAWTGPFVMAATNERVVRRSNELLGYRYGKDFRYGESVKTGPGVGGWLKGVALTGVMTMGVGALLIGPLRRVASRWIVQPGDGPSRDAINNGFFKARLYGVQQGEVVVTGTVTGTQDPGYGATACMLAETGLALALSDDLGDAGVTTTAAGLGQVLIDRLQPHRVQFEIA